MTVFSTFLIVGVICLGAAHVSITIRNSRVKAIVSNRPFAPKIPVTQHEYDGGVTPLFRAFMIPLGGALALSALMLLFGGIEGVKAIMLAFAVVIALPIAITIAIMTSFQVIDCVDDFTRFAAQATGWSAFSFVVAFLNI